jgi:DNA-binding transcriptional MerR regulator
LVDANDQELGLSTPLVRSLAGGVKRSTLEYWITKGLVEPTVVPARGNRYTRYWSVRDAVVVRLIKTLREAGCPLQRIVTAKRFLEERWGETLSSSIMIWTGSELMSVGKWGEVKSVWKHPGQLAFKAVALPVGQWREETEHHAVAVS